MRLPGQIGLPSFRVLFTRFSFGSSFFLLTSIFVLPLTGGAGRVLSQAKNPVVRVIFVGDIAIEVSWQSEPPEPGPLFDPIRERLAQADLVIGNLEEPLTDYARVTPYKSRRAVAAGRDFVFRATHPDGAKALREGGIDVVTLANNHTMDYRARGLFDTLERLTAVGIIPVGAGKNLQAAEEVQVVNLKGTRIGIISLSDVVPTNFNAGENRPGIGSSKDLERVKEVVRRARPKADVLMVAFHWGKMFTSVPNRRQRAVARAARQGGADVILGAHPHVLQGVGCLAGTPVIYSAGNFVFPTSNRKARRSAIFEIVLSGSRVDSVRVIPVQLDDQGRPHLAEGEVARRILSEMKRLSTRLGADFSRGAASCRR